MENFVAYNPVTLHFGRNILTALGPALKEYGQRVLLVYGSGSIKRTGLYDRITGFLKAHRLEVYEFGGIRPNPLIEDVDAAARVGRENNVDMVLAVGGGSVIDSAKVISLAIPVTHTAWNFFDGKATPVKGLPLVAVLTLAATGTEMNAVAVLSNKVVNLKSAMRSTLAFPRHSFLDPELTITVPRDYTAYGIADLMAHAMEVWFGAGDCPMSDRLILGILHEALEAGPALLNDLTSYDLRARIMYAATLALNGMTVHGKVSGDWGVHLVGHVLSLLYDVPHGASLTIVYPAWMRFFREQAGDRIALLGTGLFGESMDADQAIGRIVEFFIRLGCPVKLSDLDIPDLSPEAIVKAMETARVNGMHYKIPRMEYEKLVGMFV